MANNDKRKVLIRVENLKQWFPVKKTKFREKQKYVRANDGISIDIYEGETLGLVGESGCGKSTFGRSLLQLYTQIAGKTLYYGRSIDNFSPKYILKILKNIKSEMNNLDTLNSKVETLKADVEKATGDAKIELKEEYRKAKKTAALKFEDIAEILGGFMVIDEIEDACKKLAVAYEIAAKIFASENKINDVQININKEESILENYLAENQNKPASSKKLDDLKSKHKILTTELQGHQKAIENQIKLVKDIRKKYADNEEFMKYEKHRDVGIDLAKLDYHEMRGLRRDMQLIFQDPYSSLNPRMTVGQIIGEGLTAHNIFLASDPKMQEYVTEIMTICGLAPYMIHRYPHQFSGGQRQRIGIARSLALKPKFVVCDEAVSALDVSIQSQIINLLKDLKEQEKLTYLFISHDLSVVKYISDRIGVMYLGNIVELSAAEAMFELPLHPYTQALLQAIPTTDLEKKKDVPLLEGDIPSPVNPPKGCKFHTRCRYCQDICKVDEPEFTEVLENRFVACHFPLIDGEKNV